MGEITTPKPGANRPAITLKVDGAVVDLDTAKKVGASLRKAGEEKMQEAALYETRGQWGACSGYLEAAALLTKAREWAAGDPGYKLEEAAWNAGKRACDDWYGDGSRQ